jgi:hypothetical protein
MFALVPVGPGIQIHPIEGLSLATDGNLDQLRTHRRVEFRAVHAEVGGRVAHAD